MKNLLLSLVITLIVVVGGFLLHALIWEGVPQPKNAVLDGNNNGSLESAQKLLVGDYLVYSTLSPTPDGGRRVKLWRYLVSGQGAEEITSFEFGGQEPKFFKFSEESLAVWRDNHKELWHINGQLIGPAEDSQALISPDRRWLISLKADSQPVMIILQSIATGAQKDWPASDYLSSGYLVARQWSDDSRLVYLTARDASGNNLPGLWVLDLSRQEVIEFAEVVSNNISDITVYPELKQAIGVSQGSVSRVMMIDLDTGSTQQLISNKDYKLTDPKLSANSRSFSYTLLGSNPSVWLADFINPQAKQEEMITRGRLLAWPRDNIWLVARDGSLQIYNKNTNQVINLVSSDEATKSWQFIDIFHIK